MLRIHMTRMAGIALALSTFMLPGQAAAQAAPGSGRTVSLMVGGFTYDYEGDGTSPMVAVRADSRLSRRLLAEVGISYVRADVDIVDYTPSDPVSREGIASVGAATVGVQAELPVGGLRPYVGITTGLFGRFDHGKGGNHFLRPTTEFPLGVRVPFSDRMVARGEVRLRFDEHQGSGSSVDSELTFGLGWRF